MSLFRCPVSRLFLHRAGTTSLRSHSLHPTTLRPLSTSTPHRFPRKHSQDKDSLDPQSSEYSQTGTDDEVANNPNAAFNPNKTRPEEELNTAEKESGDSTSPLNVSPGNQEASKARDPQEGGKSEGVRTGTSGGGSAPKSGGKKTG